MDPDRNIGVRDAGYDIKYLSTYLGRDDLEKEFIKPTRIERIRVFLFRPPAKDYLFPRNKLTCLAVLNYAVKFCSLPENHDLSRTLERLYSLCSDFLKKRCVKPRETAKEISEVLVKRFKPEVQRFFTVPELHQLQDKDKHLKRHEILAGFLDFLVQVLHQEGKVNNLVHQRYYLLEKGLLFRLAILGDKPFQCTHHNFVLRNQVQVMLAEFEALANEAGLFIYSCVFATRRVGDKVFYQGRDALLEKFELGKANIRQNCIFFSELPVHVFPRSNIVDSFFIINSLIEDVENFTDDEVFPVKDQIQVLNDELLSSQAFLKVFESPRGQVDGFKEPLLRIRDLAYEAEYLIKSHVVGNVTAWYVNLRLPSIIDNIKIALKRLQQSKETNKNHVMKDEEVSEITPAALDENHIMDIRNDTTKKILADLTGKPKSPRQTVSIFGMPGLGKTTTANKLYCCSSASHYFDRRVWCVVSQTYDVRVLLVQILKFVAPELKEDDVLKKKNDELGVCIHKSLKQRRYLIVLDDVWHSKAWTELERYLPDDKNGSRAVLTSRIKDAAPDDSIFHTLPLLSNDQCWDLLEKKVFHKESCPSYLLNIGKAIAAKCSGMPLAVVVAAGILVNLEEEKSAWERVENFLNELLLDGQSSYKKILELSYEQLPHNIKPCFLYFAAFPEDAEIPINKLLWWWIAEGFIHEKEGKSQEVLAEMYLLELINRSLVLPGKRGYDGGIKSCRIHDLLHDVCVSKAREKNFLLMPNNKISIYETYQRSCPPSTAYADLRPAGLHCRALIGGPPNKSSSFQTRPLLKVLDMSNRSRPENKYLYEDDYSTTFELPIHLKYLAATSLTNRMVHNLANLEFVVVVSDWKVMLPSALLRLAKLRHVVIKKGTQFEKECVISEKINLKSFSYIHIYKEKDLEILRCAPDLQILECKCSGETLVPDLSFLNELETLKMVFKVNLSNERLADFNFPSSIKKLCLRDGKFPWEKMSIIGRLPNLCSLKLERGAFVGDEWETTDDEFKELRFLKIHDIDLRDWITCYEHFPALEHLVLYRCRKLKIPLELGEIASLHTIEVNECSTDTNLSAIEIEEEQRKSGNEELNVIMTFTDYTRKELEQERRKSLLGMGSDACESQPERRSVRIKTGGDMIDEMKDPFWGTFEDVMVINLSCHFTKGKNYTCDDCLRPLYEYVSEQMSSSYKHFSPLVVAERLNHWKNRYDYFMDFLRYDGITFNPETNTLTAGEAYLVSKEKSMLHTKFLETKAFCLTELETLFKQVDPLEF